MKKIILLVLLLMPLVIAGDQFTINVESAYTNPYPVEPGQNFVLGLQVTNQGYEKVDSAYILLDPSYPFTVLENPRKSVSNLGAGDRKIVEYNLFVDSSAISTVYEIPVRVSYGSLVTLTKSVKIRVMGTPKFEVMDFRSNEINPGDRETLNIQLQNVGSGSAKKMTATFISSSELIKPIFVGGSVYINEFKPGDKQWIKFEVVVDKDADYGVYPGTIILKYSDESGVEHQESFSIGILVSGTPRFEVVDTNVDLKNRKLEVDVINSGTASGIGIKCDLWIGEKLFDTYYITQVKIDKKSTIKFDLPTTKETNGKLVLSYRGPDNREYKQEETISWERPRGSNSILIIAIGLVGIYVLWKKPWKKLLKKKKY
ncbi:MAG: hypothetical protein QXY45_00900 [Candidatus Aenigmatarchaeota archaeon]